MENVSGASKIDLVQALMVERMASSEALLGMLFHVLLASVVNLPIHSFEPFLHSTGVSMVFQPLTNYYP